MKTHTLEIMCRKYSHLQSSHVIGIPAWCNITPEFQYFLSLRVKRLSKQKNHNDTWRFIEVVWLCFGLVGFFCRGVAVKVMKYGSSFTLSTPFGLPVCLQYTNTHNHCKSIVAGLRTTCAKPCRYQLWGLLHWQLEAKVLWTSRWNGKVVRQKIWHISMREESGWSREVSSTAAKQNNQQVLWQPIIHC